MALVHPTPVRPSIAAAALLSVANPFAAREPVFLADVTERNEDLFCDMNVAPEQERFVGTPEGALACCYVRRMRMIQPFAVYATEDSARFGAHPELVRPVGWCVVEIGAARRDDGDGDGQPTYRCHLRRFAIDCSFQRRGYGSSALAQVLAYLRTSTQHAAGTTVTLTTRCDNGAALAFYARHGFAFAPCACAATGHANCEVRGSRPLADTRAGAV